MFARTVADSIFTLHLLFCGVLLSAPAFAQRPGLDPATATLDAADADSSNRPVAATMIARSSTRRDSRWVPPEVDENVSPLESGSFCDLNELLQKTGERIQEFVKNVDRFTATESLLHESFKKSGEVSQQEHRKYEYMMSIEEIRPKIFAVEEFQRNTSSPVDVPGGVATKGLPTLVLIFHPYYSENYSMRCEGLTTLNGQPTWQIYFRQRADKPNRIRAYKIGWQGPSYPVALKGRAWFAADSYQIVGLQTDLIDALPDIRLQVDHTAIEYGPVHFSSRNVEIWLPQNAEVYSDLKGRRFHQRMTFSDYLLFAVDDKQKVSPPKTDP
jgi:hypothetical protein